MALLEILDQQQNRLAYVATFGTKEKEKLPQAYEWTLTFAVPMTDPGYQYIEEFNFVRVGGANGQLFTIRKIEETLAMDGSTIGVVFCEHVSYELLDDYLVDNRAVDSSAGFALHTALINSPQFTVGTVEPTGINTGYFVQCTPTKAINLVMERWGGEAKFDNREVNLLNQRGADKGLQIREGKNLKTLKRTVDATSIVTRLFGYGMDGITVESINGGLAYIDSANASLYKKADGSARYLVGEIKTDDQTPEDLLASMQAHLAQNEVPFVTYQVELLELKTLPGFELEEHELGDTVAIISPKLSNTNIKARIVEYEHDLDYPEKSKVTIANFLPNLVENSLMAMEETRQAVNDSLAVWNRARSFNPDGTLATTFLQGAINALTNQIVASGAYTSAQVLENKGLLFENTDETSSDFGALYIGPGILAIADSKNEEGKWDWRTGGTGSGLTADAITSGKILTNLVRIEGDSNFYWDGAALYCIDPQNANRQIRINKEGIKLTTNGGANWSVAIDYAGFKIGGGTGDAIEVTRSFFKATHTDGSYTRVDASGFKRYVAGTGKEYHYLSHTGQGATLGNSVQFSTTCTGDKVYYITQPTAVTIQLPDEFKGKDFSVIVSFMSGQNVASGGYVRTYLNIDSIDKPNGRFTVSGYVMKYYSTTYAGTYCWGGNTYDGANFSYLAIA